MIEITRQDQEGLDQVFNVFATSLIFDGTYTRISKAETHHDAHREARSLQDYFETKGEAVTVACAECVTIGEVEAFTGHAFTCTLCKTDSACKIPDCTGECVDQEANWCVRCVTERIRQLGFNV